MAVVGAPAPRLRLFPRGYRRFRGGGLFAVLWRVSCRLFYS